PSMELRGRGAPLQRALVGDARTSSAAFNHPPPRGAQPRLLSPLLRCRWLCPVCLAASPPAVLDESRVPGHDIDVVHVHRTYTLCGTSSGRCRCSCRSETVLN